MVLRSSCSSWRRRGGSAPRAAADDIAISASQVPLDGDDLTRITLGKLTYRGGLSLTSPDRRFGGLSGLLVLEGGKGIVAISDAGWWVTARLVHDRDGKLIDVADGKLGPLRDPSGRPLRGKVRGDAESLTPLSDGLAVGFERNHRIWRYPYGSAPFAAPPVPVPSPPGLRRAPANLGLESLAALPDGRLFALTEGLASGPGTLQGWIGEGPGLTVWHKFDWVRHGAFAPSDATTLPDGGLLVLERRYTLIGGVAARILRIAPGDIRPGGAARRHRDRRFRRAGDPRQFRGNLHRPDAGRRAGDLRHLRRQLQPATAHAAADVHPRAGLNQPAGPQDRPHRQPQTAHDRAYDKRPRQHANEPLHTGLPPSGAVRPRLLVLLHVMQNSCHRLSLLINQVISMVNAGGNRPPSSFL